MVSLHQAHPLAGGPDAGLDVNHRPEDVLAHILPGEAAHLIGFAFNASCVQLNSCIHIPLWYMLHHI